MTPAELRARIDAAPMSAVQRRVVLVTFLLSMLDGYDVLAMTFVAPQLSLAWGLGKAAVGALLAAGLAGMAAGALLLAPLADAIGRRRMIFAALALMTAGSLLSALAASVPALTAARIVTGLGIGACVAVINPLAAEFSNARRRPLALALTAMGYPLGGLFGGVVAGVLLKLAGWQWVFAAGSGFALLLLPAALAFLPESIAYLLARGGAVNLARLNAVLARCGHPQLDTSAPAPREDARGYRALAAPRLRMTTLRLSLVSVLHAAAAYFVLSWLPQMIGDMGFSASAASYTAAGLSLSGIVGGLLVGAVAQRHGVTRPTAACIALLAAALAGFGMAPASLAPLALLALLCGFALFGSAAGFFGVVALSFPDVARASGTGLVSGAGRISSAVAPLMAGMMFEAGLGRAPVAASFALCAIAAALLLLAHPTGARRRALR